MLQQIGFKNFEIISPKFDEEKYSKDLPIKKKVLEFSYLKAQSVNKLKKRNNIIIISGDTEVFRCGKIYSKCFSKEQVKKNLLELSGKKHFVLGGICVIDKHVIKRSFSTTEVYFDRIPKSELSNKFLINEGIGKAGGYAIQGHAAKFVRKIRGSYTNVVGLCLNSLSKILIDIGFKN